jgi:hypothetical protein
MPGRYVQVFRLSDGRWTWRLVEDGVPHMETGPAYEKRAEAVTAAAHLFPEDALEVEEK